MKYSNIEKLIRITGNDISLIKEMLQSFIDQFPVYVTDAVNAYEKGDMYALRESAHKLKSGILLVAGDEFFREISEIEKISKEGVLTSELTSKMDSFSNWFPLLIEELKERLITF